MKKTHSHQILLICFSMILMHKASGQCANSVNLGSSANMLTLVRNNTNPVVVDNTLNTILYIHRNNPNIYGGSSGHLRYDISTDGGFSWLNNQGVLNPLNSNQGRYPNAVIHNPSGNNIPANAYLGYMAATTNGSTWNGVVTGARQLNGASNTETYNQPGASSYLIAGSLVKGAPGVFWSIDNQSDGSNTTGGINVYKGTWNGSGDITWNTNTVLYPNYNVWYNGDPRIGEANIAFDPSGKFGWICIMTHLSSHPSTYGYYPAFYKSTNGGNSWTGPFTPNLNQYSCITSNMASGFVPACDFQCDLTVDVFGDPHLLTTVGHSMNNYVLDYNRWHHMFDITQKHGNWTAYDVANVKAGPGVFYGSTFNVYQLMSPQVARTTDGTKIFFGWADNSIYSTGDQNTWPDFFARGLDVIQNKWTPVKDFTSCNFNISGSILLPHLAPEVLQSGPGVYQLAPVYGAFTSSDPDLVANFKFLNNVTFGNSDFTINQPMLNPGLSPSSSAILCAGGVITLQVNGGFPNTLWSNGSMFNSIPVNTPGNYYVSVRSGCMLGVDSISIKTLTMNLSSDPVMACEGSHVTLSVTGNANSYTWVPSQVTGSSHTVLPTANTTYTVRGSGYGNCSEPATILISVNPLPDIFAYSDKQLVCAGEEVVLHADGALSYTWSTGATAASATVYPQQTTIYSVTGYNAFGCSATFTLNQLVEPCTGIIMESAPGVLLVFPNPSSGKFNVNSGSAGRISLVNILGQVLETAVSEASNNYTVEFNAPCKGIYFIVADINGGISTRKVVAE